MWKDGRVWCLDSKAKTRTVCPRGKKVFATAIVRAEQQSMTHLPQEEPLAVVEESDHGCNDNGSLHVLGHVLEDWGQEEQHKHDNQGTNDSCQL